jgi:hypothetical protein
MAEMCHQAGNDRIRFNAQPEHGDADVSEDAVEALNQEKRDQDEVAEERRLCWLAYFRQRDADK